MARTLLRHIRVNSVDELQERILKGIAEFNATPVVFPMTSSISMWLDMS
jgi:hypothetical protein